jgi:cation diffusion facilitator family transporter
MTMLSFSLHSKYPYLAAEIMSGNKAIQVVYWGIVLNIVLAVLKGVFGYAGSSEALLADAVESTSDVFASALVLVGLRYAARPADHNHPYGHGRAEALFTFIVVGFLMITATIIAYRSVINLYTPHKSPAPYTLWVLGFTIITKEAFYRISTRRAREANSMLVHGDAWHHRSDALTSLAAFVGILIALWLGEGYESADDYAALLTCIVIMYNAYRLIRPALGEIMDEHVYDELVKDIRRVSEKVEGVKGTEKCFVRKSGNKHYVDLHISVDAYITVQQGHTIAHHVQDTIVAELPQVAQVLIHVEPDVAAK